jgi:hypothetical protein
MYYAAANIVLENKENMIEDITSWIKNTHPNRTDSLFAENKCRRDLSTVINAFINGLKFNNKENIQFLVEEFYRNNTLQLQSTDVEIACYTMLRDQIIELCGGEIHADSVSIQAINYIKYLYNELTTQLVNGPVYTQMNIEKASFIAERCQRNWDYDNPVSIADYNSIIQSATTMPSKQNRQYYSLLVSTNKDFNRLCYSLAVDRTNPHFDQPIHRNGQVLAPMLMIFMPADESEIDDPFNDDFEKNFHTSIGISSGVAAHSAAMLGYKTGFCACAAWGEMYTALNEQYNIPIPVWNRGLMLGIGNPMWEYSRQAVLLDGTLYDTDDSYDKIVDINFVH